MKNSDFLLEKVKRREAVSYASNLAGIYLNNIVSTEEIPGYIPNLIEKIISIDSKPIDKIAIGVQTNELILWVTGLLNDSSSNRFF